MVKNRRKLRIGIIAPLWIPVPPFTYGGIEFMVSLLTEELVKRGHQVTLFASGDSRTKARLIPIWPKSIWRANVRYRSAIYSLLLKKVIDLQDEFDIIQDNCEFYTVFLSQFLKVPLVSRIGHPLTEEVIILYKKFSQVNYVALSENQRKTGPGINFVATIYNGIPVEKYPFNPNPQNYLLWLSKIIPEKGIIDAIEVAKITGEKLIICGIVPKEQRDFFEYRVRPLIDGEQIRFVGQADFEKKVNLFKNAKAFLFPTKLNESFGTVMIEAMACGTPVIAYPNGAIPEVVENNKNGFLVKSEREMIEAVEKIGQINRNVCREHIVKNFNLEKMVDGYENLYYKILKKKR
ncbi:glycosyltransferase family 4 protein [bacterium]|nr:glycosyltransferase family 4 protein [bacterium]